MHIPLLLRLLRPSDHDRPMPEGATTRSGVAAKSAKQYTHMHSKMHCSLHILFKAQKVSNERVQARINTRHTITDAGIMQ